MIYVDKDFYYNFAEASQDADPQKLRAVVIAQIADVIKKNRKGLVLVLNKSGIQIATNVSNKDLVTLLVHNLTGNNKRLIRGLAELIEHQQSTIGEKNPNAVPLVENGIGAVFGLFGKQKSIESDNISAILAIVEGKSASGKTLSVDASAEITSSGEAGNWWKNMSGMNKGLLVVALAVTAYFGYKYFTKNKVEIPNPVKA